MCRLHPRAFLSVVESSRDMQPAAIRRLRYPKYRRDAPTPVIKTCCCQPKIAVCARRPFSTVEAALAACFGRFDGLGVQDADGWRQVAIQRSSRQLTQRIIDFDECSISIP